MNEAMIGFLGVLVGAIVSGIFSYWGSVSATKREIKMQKEFSKEKEKESIKIASRNLKVKFDVICNLLSLAIPEVSPTDIVVSEVKLESSNLLNDLSIISHKLNESDYNKLFSYYADIKRGDEIMARVWELRAEKLDFSQQAKHYSKIAIKLLAEREKVNDILNTLINNP